MYGKSLIEIKTDESYERYLDEKLSLVLITSEDKKKETPIDVDNRPLEEIIGKEKAEKFKNYTVSEFVSGFAKICKKVDYDEEYNIINTDGIVVSDIWYSKIYDYFEGYALAGHKEGLTFVDRAGNRINDDWYTSAHEFRNGYARVCQSIGMNLIDTKGNYVSKEWYDEITYFKEGFAIVKKDYRKYNFIDKNGHLIGNTWYFDVRPFSNGIAIVQKGKKWNYINKEGKLLSKDWFKSKPQTFSVFGIVPNYYNDPYTYSLIAKDGSVIFKDAFTLDVTDSCISVKSVSTNWGTEKYEYYDKKNFIIIYLDYKERKYICKDIDYNGYSVNKTIFNSYNLKKEKDSFIVKGKPIKVFGSNYVLHFEENDPNYLSLYDRKNKNEITIGSPCSVVYTDNIIVNNDSGTYRAYLIYNDKLYDITDYYFHNIKPYDIKIFGVKEGYEIYTRDDYYLENETRLINEVREEKEEERKQEEIEQKKYTISKLDTIKEIDVFSKDANEYRRQKALEKVREGLQELMECDGKDNAPSIKIQVTDLFINCGDHKEFNPKYIEGGFLKYIDLSRESFENVKMSGIDFSGCNIILNPQVVYPKDEPDLTNCNFEGIHISAFLNFTGVDIRGSRFSDDNNSRTVDGLNVYFKEAIYDETTTYNGIPFNVIYGECKNIKRISKH